MLPELNKNRENAPLQFGPTNNSSFKAFSNDVFTDPSNTTQARVDTLSCVKSDVTGFEKSDYYSSKVYYIPAGVGAKKGRKSHE